MSANSIFTDDKVEWFSMYCGRTTHHQGTVVKFEQKANVVWATIRKENGVIMRVQCNRIRKLKINAEIIQMQTSNSC